MLLQTIYVMFRRGMTRFRALTGCGWKQCQIREDVAEEAYGWRSTADQTEIPRRAKKNARL